MKWIERVTGDQASRIREVAIRWRNAARSTNPVDPFRAEEAVKWVYRCMHLTPPEEFLWYPSPLAAFTDFSRWSGRKGRVTTQFWSYQLPLCDPGSYFQRCSKCDWIPREVSDLGVERRPNAYGAMVHTERLGDPAGLPILKSVLKEAWECVRSAVGRGWVEEVDCALADQFRSEFIDLEDAVDREDPTSQVHPRDYYLLGPLEWLVPEAACAEACRDILGARISADHVTAVSSLVGSCGPSYCFERLGVMCERPHSIKESSEGALEIGFRDGFTIATRPR